MVRGMERGSSNPILSGWSFLVAQSLRNLVHSAEAAVEAAKVCAANNDFSISGSTRSTITLELKEDLEDLRQGLILARPPG